MMIMPTHGPASAIARRAAHAAKPNACWAVEVSLMVTNLLSGLEPVQTGVEYVSNKVTTEHLGMRASKTT